MFEEIDYVLEGHNAERFASIYACYSSKFPSIIVSELCHACQLKIRYYSS